jgi:hypothetical protein
MICGVIGLKDGSADTASSGNRQKLTECLRERRQALEPPKYLGQDVDEIRGEL